MYGTAITCDKCSGEGFTIEYDADSLIRQAQAKVALELTYTDYPLRKNSHQVAELAMGALGSIRHYLEDTGNGIIIPGLYTSAIYSRVEEDEESGIYKLDYE